METSNHFDWWKKLEPQWQEAFKAVIPGMKEAPDADALAAIFNLQTIRLVGPSAPFPNLKFELTNLSGLQDLHNLTIIIITHHKIENICELSGLTQVTSLFLFNNSITSLEGIEGFTALEQLYVHCNQITSIKPVEHLLNLKEFYINDNCITSLDGLTEGHSDKLLRFICQPNSQLKQKEIIRAERDLGIICRG